MNDKTTKAKKHPNAQTRQQPLHKHPSASSIKQLQGHCLPKDPPNITAYHHFAHPRKQEEYKENKNRDNQNLLVSIKDQIKTKNVLLQPRKSNQLDDPLRKTQKRSRKGPLRSEWVSPDDEGLGCHEHLSSQIFRQSGQNSISQRKTGQTGYRPMSIEEQLASYQRKLPSIAWNEDQEALAQLVKLEQLYSNHPNYSNYLDKQTNITWKRRALALDWSMLLASELNCRREAFAVSVSILDRYLAASPTLPLDKLQLTAATCLLIAQKLEDNSRIRTNCFYQPISERHTLEDLLNAQIQIAMTLKFRLKAPTINAWANRLCAQWDLWISKEGGGIETRFKGADNDSYHNWRWISQYIDFAILDIQTLQYKNRTLAAAFLYLTLLLKLEIYTSEEIAIKFRKESHYILSKTPFNSLFSRFLLESFGFPLEQILPTIQYCSGFTVLPVRFELPTLIREDELSFQQYCGIQTWNECNKAALEHLDRTFW